jgi:hypothetical protein
VDFLSPRPAFDSQVKGAGKQPYTFLGVRAAFPYSPHYSSAFLCLQEQESRSVDFFTGLQTRAYAPDCEATFAV